MSVFIVSTKTIDRCVFAISQMYYNDMDKKLDYKTLNNIGQDLLRVNYIAYNARYKENISYYQYQYNTPNLFLLYNDYIDYDNNYFIDKKISVNTDIMIIYGLLRAVTVLMYQINEDITCNSKEYNLLNDTKKYLCKIGNINYSALDSCYNHSIWDNKEFNKEFYC